MIDDSKKSWLVYLVGSCEMGSEGYSSMMYPCVCYGDTDEEILSDYLANIETLYGSDFMRKNLSFNESGNVSSYYPIHKVRIPREVYGRVEDYIITLRYEDHRDDPEDELSTSSFTYEGESFTVKTCGGNKNENIH